jgi:hypothetical protein
MSLSIAVEGEAIVALTIVRRLLGVNRLLRVGGLVVIATRTCWSSPEEEFGV